jgi:hypothetical protein
MYLYKVPFAELSSNEIVDDLVKASKFDLSYFQGYLQ